MTAADYLKQPVGASVFDGHRLETELHRNPNRMLPMLSVLERFLEEDVSPVQAIREACQRNQFAQAEHMLFNLNGYSQNIGGYRVSELAEEIEDLLGRDANIHVVSELINCLEREYQSLIKSVRHWLDDFKRSHPDSSPLHAMFMATQINHLKLCLNEHSFKAFDLMQDLEMRLQQHMDASNFESLQMAMSNLDFDSALHCIEKTQFV